MLSVLLIMLDLIIVLALTLLDINVELPTSLWLIHDALTVELSIVVFLTLELTMMLCVTVEFTIVSFSRSDLLIKEWLTVESRIVLFSSIDVSICELLDVALLMLLDTIMSSAL